MQSGNGFSLVDNTLGEEQAYWRSRMKGLEELACLMPDREAEGEDYACQYELQLDEALSQKILLAAKNNDSLVFAVLLSGIYLLLRKIGKGRDRLVGTSIYSQGENAHFLNYLLLLRDTAGEEVDFRGLLSATRDSLAEANKFQNYPYTNILSVHKLPPVIDTVAMLDNIHPGQYLNGIPFNQLFRFNKNENAITLKIEYNGKRILKETAIRWANLYQAGLSAAFGDASVPVSKLNWLDERDRYTVLWQNNKNVIDFPGLTLLEKMTVHSSSEEIALSSPEGKYSFRELHERSARLALYLNAEGVKNNTTVAVLMAPSAGFIISLLAIMKAGGCYVPLDPKLPFQRKMYIASDSCACFVLSDAANMKEASELLKVTGTGRLVNIEDGAVYLEVTAKNAELPAVDPGNGAYILYTSGSTGYPKGARISHANLHNYISWACDTYIGQEKPAVPLFTSISFDLTITSIFLPLVAGGRIIIYSEQEYESAIAQIIRLNEATFIKLTPSHLRMVREIGHWPYNLRTVIVGGELFDRQLAFDIHKLSGGSVSIYNEYGPTEATVGCAIYKYNPEEKKGKTVLIGKPAPNCEMFVLDGQMQPVPFGLEGEIYIGGKQLVDGYMPSVKNAKESFIDNPFAPGTKLYRTGDNCIMYEDGNLECTGRLNNQVKLNGFRIEPGEIEARLNSFPGISASVVVMQHHAGGTSCLSAFYLAENTIGEEALVDHLAGFLPAYMIPLFFTRMDEFPLTINGKIDTSALAISRGETSTEKRRVLSEKDAVLTGILSLLLGEPVCVEDNFFKKGGDSIKMVQLAARLLKAGYKISIKDIYNHPVVADLARLIEPVKVLADQGRVEGAAALNPVQQWFFEHYTEVNHYNQSLLLFSGKALDMDALQMSVAALLDHHDALRMEVRKEKNILFLYSTADVRAVSVIMFFDFRDHEQPDLAMREQANQIQSSMDIQTPRFFKLALFRLPDGDRLLMVIHHLVTDGVSWRILLEDLNEAYMSALNGKKIVLPPKTTSFATWNNSLELLVVNGYLDSDHVYWTSLDCGNVQQIPVDHPMENALLKDKVNQSFFISEQLTGQLSLLMSESYQAGINEFFLAGIAMAARQVFNITKLAVALEGHGRENIPDSLDISRTVGWFTSIYPFILDIGEESDTPLIIKNISDQAKAIPGKGASYGMLKYAGKTPSAPIYQLAPRISLNYLGGFDEDIKSDWFSLASESSGNSVDGHNPMVYDLEIRAIKLNKQLQVNIFYNKHVFNEETISGFKTTLYQLLTGIIEAGDIGKLSAGTIKFRSLHPDLDAAQERSLVSRFDPAAIYPLSPMQLGLYFHALANPGSYYYNTFFSYRISGRFEAVLLKESFNIILCRYPILRANFTMEGLTSPALLVARKKEIPFEYIDLRYRSRSEQEQFLVGYRKDLLEKPYDFTNDTMMRVSVLETDNNEFVVIWCYHHILIDGWCLNTLWKDLLTVYYFLMKGIPVDLPPAVPYTDYLHWLRDRDFNLSRSFWNDYLQGYNRSEAYIAPSSAAAQVHGKKDMTISCRPDADTVEKLIDLAREQNCTIYTVLQCAWGLALSKVSGANDIVFGQVVSGRPNIPGISEMVGLFINTIPKRLKIDEEMTIAELIQQVWKDEIACLDHQFCPLRDIVKMASPDAELFDHVIVFENQYQLMNIGDEKAQLDFDIAVADSYDPNEYDLSIFIFLKNQELSFDIRYNAYRNTSGQMTSVVENLHSILKWMADPGAGAIGDMFVSLLQMELKLPGILSL